MASTSSKLIPIGVLALIACTMFVEVAYDIHVNLEQYVPILGALSLGGVTKSVLTTAINTRKVIPENIEALVKAEIGKVLPKKSD